MKFFKVAVVLICTVGMACGCASIVGKSLYPVTINSDPDGANITIVDETGKATYTGKTPTTVTLEAKAGYFKGKDYTVTFSKEGYTKYSAQIKRGVSGWYIGGNILFGGLIGWLIIDPMTGAMWTLDKDVKAVLSRETSGSSERDDSLRIVSIDNVPDSLRTKMVRIK